MAETNSKETNSTMTTDIVIVGGAVAGAALACALAKYNLRVLVIDRRKDVGSMNRGDGLQPRTLEILQQWGVLQHLQQLPHVKSSGIALRHGLLGQLLNIDLTPLQDSSFNYIMNIPHREIEQGLLDWADQFDNIQLMRGSSVEQLIYNDEGNVSGVVIKDRKEAISCYAKIVIAADGGQSFVRRQLNIAAERILYNHELVVLHMPRPASLQKELKTNVYLHRDGAVVLIPLPNEQMRITIVVPAGKAAQWRKYSDSELMQELARRIPELNHIGFMREGEHVYKMVRMHAGQYHAKQAALIGDAAHQTHAASGQGMNMAIQDADILSRLLAQCLHNERSLQEALNLYEQIRKPINEEIISRSSFMSSVVFTESKLLHSCKMLGMFLLRVIPPLRSNISRGIARGIAGIDQRKHIESQFSLLLNNQKA